MGNFRLCIANSCTWARQCNEMQWIVWASLGHNSSHQILASISGQMSCTQDALLLSSTFLDKVTQSSEAIYRHRSSRHDRWGEKGASLEREPNQKVMLVSHPILLLDTMFCVHGAWSHLKSSTAYWKEVLVRGVRKRVGRKAKISLDLKCLSYDVEDAREFSNGLSAVALVWQVSIFYPTE